MADEKAKQVDLGAMIETARQGARKQLSAVADAITRSEQFLANAKADRESIVREAAKVLDTAEIAAILGVSTGTVSNWARDPEAPKRTRKVAAVNGRTGEPVEVEVPELAQDEDLPDTNVFEALETFEPDGTPVSS